MPDTTNYQKHASKNPLQKFLIEKFYSTMFKIVKPTKPQKILDVGCGEGFTLVNLSRNKIGKTYEGVEYSNNSIRLAKKLYPGLNIKKGDIYDLQYRDNSFDMVICTEVLEHLKDPQKALRELARVTSKYVLFSVPNEPIFTLANLMRGKYLKTLGNHPGHINHWTQHAFKKYLRKNGFKISTSKTPFPWTLVLARK